MSGLVERVASIPKVQIITAINQARAKLVRVGWCQNQWMQPHPGTKAPCAYCLLAALSEAADPYAPSPDDNIESDNVHVAALRVVEVVLPVEFRFVTIDPKHDRGVQVGGLVWNLTHYNDDKTTTKTAVIDLLARAASAAARSPA